MKKTTRVNIIIVTFNGLNYTKLAIKSLLNYTDYNCYLTIIDNGSTDGTIEYLESIKPSKYVKEIKIVKNKENIGFGGGILMGSKLFDTEYVCASNNDLFFSKNWLSKMVNIMDSNTEIGILGPLSPVIWCKHPYSVDDTRKVMAGLSEKLSVSEELSQYCYGKRYDTFVKDLLATNSSPIKYFEGPPSHIMGFLTLIRKSAAEKSGGILDLHFQFGSDDTDLSWRLFQNGYKLAVTSDVYIHHFKHRSFKVNKIDHNKVFSKINIDFFNIWYPTIEKFLIKEINNGVNVNEKMLDEKHYDYWVLRRLNETITFWKDNQLIPHSHIKVNVRY